MLVLSRHVHESVTLTLPDGRQIVVTLVRGGTDKVRLGFDAPADVQIARDDAHSLRPAPGRTARPAPPTHTGPQSAGNGPPCDRAGGGVQTPGSGGYVPRRLREGR